MHHWEIKRVEIIQCAACGTSSLFMCRRRRQGSSLSGATITFLGKISYGVKILARAGRCEQGAALPGTYLFIGAIWTDAASIPNNSPQQYLCVLEKLEGKMDSFSRYKTQVERLLWHVMPFRQQYKKQKTHASLFIGPKLA